LASVLPSSTLRFIVKKTAHLRLRASENSHSALSMFIYCLTSPSARA
jgi:hypothetical protein